MEMTPDCTSTGTEIETLSTV